MAYIPNPETGTMVRRCVRAGIIDHAIIAKISGITVSQLETNYPVELEMSNNEDLMEVADVAFDMAVSGKFPHMTQWYLRVKGGHHWREADNALGGDDSPITVVLKGSADDIGSVDVEIAECDQ
jgi:hypothetical protein